MNIEEINKLKKGEIVGFAAILATEYRLGKFVKKLSDYLVIVDYDGDIEANHIGNIFDPELLEKR
jgi:hypothetical protein